MQKEFNVDFLGLDRKIDEDVIRAMFQGDGDITKLRYGVHRRANSGLIIISTNY